MSGIGPQSLSLSARIQDDVEIIPVSLTEHLFPTELPARAAFWWRCLLLIQPVYHLPSRLPSFSQLREADGIHEILHMLQGHVPRVIDAREGKLRNRHGSACQRQNRSLGLVRRTYNQKAQTARTKHRVRVDQHPSCKWFEPSIDQDSRFARARADVRKNDDGGWIDEDTYRDPSHPERN